MQPRAVIFDLGGVVVDSPLHVIARYEAELALPKNFVNRLVVSAGDGGAWARLERGELAGQEFEQAFDAECATVLAATSTPVTEPVPTVTGTPSPTTVTSKPARTFSAAVLMARIAECAPRPQMLAAITKLRAAGLRVAALTNNWKRSADETQTQMQAQLELRAHFDAFIESAVLGLRKPDPRIYHHACAALRVAPEEAVFLDDIGRNLKAARALGMHTIKVETPARALAELAAATGVAL